MTLEQEAEQYGKNKSSSQVFIEAHMNDYIAGATSKYVEIEKIKFAIEQLQKIDENKCSGSEHNAFYDLLEMQSNVIKELEQKLKELENK